MKTTILILLLLLCALTLCAQNYLVGETGAVILHVNQQYAKKLQTLLYRPQVGIGYLLKYNKYYGQLTLFTGKDCLNGNIYGVLITTGLDYRYFKLGLICGGYRQNSDYWHERGYLTRDYMPILGITCGFKIPVGDRLTVINQNILTPIIFTSNLGLMVRI